LTFGPPQRRRGRYRSDRHGKAGTYSVELPTEYGVESTDIVRSLRTVRLRSAFYYVSATASGRVTSREIAAA
jgi:hypothetical protein